MEQLEKNSYHQPTRNQENIGNKKSRAEKLLEIFGVREGDPVSLDLLRKLFLANEEEIMEGLQRNFYHGIKSSLCIPRMQPIRSSQYVIRQKNRQMWNDQDRKVIDFVWFLETVADTQEAKWKIDGEHKLIFSFSSPRDRVDKEIKSNNNGAYTGNDAFHLDGTYITKESMGLLDKDTTRGHLKDIHEEQTLDTETGIPYEIVKSFLEKILREPVEFKNQEQQLDDLWSTYNFPEADKIKLKRAIWEFANYDFKYTESRDSADFQGRCLTVPHQFNKFLADRFGLDLKECDFYGSVKSRNSLSIEERAELDAERAPSAVHYASIYKSTIIFDWTARQFGKDAECPAITDINTNERLKNILEVEGVPLIDILKN